MATPFTDIYEIFLSKVSDFDFTRFDEEELKDQLKPHLMSAIVKFRKCRKNLNDNDGNEFSETLDLYEKNILAVLMIIQYLDTQIISTRSLRQHMTDRDFRLSSQANHLRQVIDTQKHYQKTASKLISEYTYLSEEDGL